VVHHCDSINSGSSGRHSIGREGSSGRGERGVVHHCDSSGVNHEKGSIDRSEIILIRMKG
jgi:hypothetical protein